MRPAMVIQNSTADDDRPKQRYKITIEYDGSFFCGWQRQAPTIASIQGSIEEALNIITGQQCLVEGSGRTDTGVHALGQVAHVDLYTDSNKNIPDYYALLRGLNHFLVPKGIVIHEIKKVSIDFHARFSARQRSYLYRILNRSTPSVLRRKRCWHLPTPLNMDLMKKAATLLIGHHDFSGFRSSHCQASSAHRTLEKVEIFTVNDEIHCVFEARSFLHNQVRIMMGTLVDIAYEKLPLPIISEILTQPDRKKAGITAPAHGLYFLGVSY
jgi:tRNA pseudouridine38-40 synthase